MNTNFSWARSYYMIIVSLLGWCVTSQSAITQTNPNIIAESNLFFENPKLSIRNHVLANWATYKKLVPHQQRFQDVTKELAERVERGADLFTKPQTLFSKIKKAKTKEEIKGIFADLLWFFYFHQSLFSVSVKGPEAYAVLIREKNLYKALLKVLKYLSSKNWDDKEGPLVKAANYQELAAEKDNFLPNNGITQALYRFSHYYPNPGKSKTKAIFLPNGDQSIVFKHTKEPSQILIRPEPRGLGDPLRKVSKFFGSPLKQFAIISGISYGIDPLLDNREIRPQEIQARLNALLKDADRSTFELLQEDILSPQTKQLLHALALPGDPKTQIGGELQDTQSLLKNTAALASGIATEQEKEKLIRHRQKTLQAKVAGLFDLATNLIKKQHEQGIPAADDLTKIIQQYQKGYQFDFTKAEDPSLPKELIEYKKELEAMVFEQPTQKKERLSQMPALSDDDEEIEDKESIYSSIFSAAHKEVIPEAMQRPPYGQEKSFFDESAYKKFYGIPDTHKKQKFVLDSLIEDEADVDASSLIEPEAGSKQSFVSLIDPQEKKDDEQKTQASFIEPEEETIETDYEDEEETYESFMDPEPSAQQPFFSLIDPQEDAAEEQEKEPLFAFQGNKEKSSSLVQSTLEKDADEEGFEDIAF